MHQRDRRKVTKPLAWLERPEWVECRHSAGVCAKGGRWTLSAAFAGEINARSVEGPRNGRINVIAPYRYLDMWVFDDPRAGLSAEPFVGGADTMIDRITGEIPNAADGFVMVF